VVSRFRGATQGTRTTHQVGVRDAPPCHPGFTRCLLLEGPKGTPWAPPGWSLDPIGLGSGEIRLIAPQAICNETRDGVGADCGSPVTVADAASLPYRNEAFDAAASLQTPRGTVLAGP